MRPDPIIAADRAEERCAAGELRATTTPDELGSAWWRSCDHFQGAARERLQAVYSEKLMSMGALQG